MVFAGDGGHGVRYLGMRSLEDGKEGTHFIFAKAVTRVEFIQEKLSEQIVTSDMVVTKLPFQNIEC